METEDNQSIDERLSNYTDALTVLDPVITSLEKQGFIKYFVHRYTFVAGVALLVLARAYVPAKQFMCSL